jgi:hypothetical protein
MRKSTVKINLTERFEIEIIKDGQWFKVGQVFTGCFVKKPIDGLWCYVGGDEYNIPLDHFKILRRY